MPYRTQGFRLFPWAVGINLNDDPLLLSPKDCVAIENCVLGTDQHAHMREGNTHGYDDGTSVVGTHIIGATQFRYGTIPKTDQRIAVNSDGTVYVYTSGGTRSTPSGSTAWISPTRVSFETINNKLILAADGDSNVPKVWDGTTLDDLDGAPNFSICRRHQSRLFTDDKSTPDLLNYSSPFDETLWSGEGDSGAIPLESGDGDEGGIVGIFPTFKGDLFVGKKTKLGRISGDDPASYQITVVSNGIGVEAHNSIAAVDQDDVLWLSRRGVHSLNATLAYGDFKATFVSKNIAPIVANRWPVSQLQYAQAAYVPEINSVAFAVTDSAYSDTMNKVIWFYNMEKQVWYCWPNIDCTALFNARDQDRNRLYLGTSYNRLSKSFNGLPYDIETDSSHTAIPCLSRTGFIFVDQNPEIIKGFKKVGLSMRLTAATTVKLKVKIDNFDATEYTISGLVLGPLLGSTFTLGASVLGASTVIAPFWQSIDGYGRAIQVEVSKNETASDLELLGLFIEHEPLGPAQEMAGT